MGRLSWCLVGLLVGCVTTPAPSWPSGSPLQARLDALPRCQPGAEVGLLEVRATLCTRKHCQEACCNQCSWAATFQAMSGSRPADQAQVQELLGLPESALDCEIAAWATALASQSISLDQPRCVVR